LILFAVSAHSDFVIEVEGDCLMTGYEMRTGSTDINPCYSGLSTFMVVKKLPHVPGGFLRHGETGVRGGDNVLHLEKTGHGSTDFNLSKKIFFIPKTLFFMFRTVVETSPTVIGAFPAIVGTIQTIVKASSTMVYAFEKEFFIVEKRADALPIMELSA
jgi:hypothetical protein